MKLRHFFSQPDRRELNQELQFHFERLVEENVKRGLSGEEARRQARLAFGDFERAAEQTAGEYPGWWADILRQDLRYALRGLRRNLVFASAAVLTLALGIGATTAVFSVVDRILFRSLPYAHDDRLVSVGLVAPIMPQEFMLGNSYYVWKQTQTPFEKITSWSGVGLCDLTEENPAHLACARVESDFLPTLGIGLLRGRNFLTSEDVPNAPPVALISQAIWKSRFGSAEDVVGKTVSIDGTTTRIVGVLPPSFEMPTLERADILVPQRVDVAAQQRPGVFHVMFAVGRLKPGTTAAQAGVALQPQFEQALSLAPARFRSEVHMRVRSLRDFQVHEARLTAWVLLIAVLAVLLIAGANVAGLLLARAADRQTEFAIRKSLGASRARLLCQMLIESLLLSIFGVLAGCAFGELLLRVFVAMAPQGIPYINQARLDLRVLVFAVVVALASGVVFGAAPFWTHGMQRTTSPVPKSNLNHGRGRQLLLIAQISVTLVLITAAGLLLRTVRNLQNQSLGITTDRLLTAKVHFGKERYANPARKVQFVDQFKDRLQQVPGVSAVAISDTLPPGGDEHDQIFGALAIEGRPKPDGGTGGRVAWRWVTPAYFSAMGIRITRGAAFTEAQQQGNDHLAALSETLARRMFPGEDPIGKRVLFGGDPWYTVVAVVTDAKNSGLSNESEPEYYRLWRNRPEDWVGESAATFTLRTVANSRALESTVRSEAAGLDNQAPIEFETMQQRVATLAERPRFEAALLAFFSIAAIALAAIGLYGVIAFVVSRRTQEIAVRIALGAGKRQILALIGRDGLRMIAVGAALGLAAAISVSHLIAKQLFGVSAYDALTLLAAVAVLALIGMLAMWLPMRRAVSVDPMRALRYE